MAHDPRAASPAEHTAFFVALLATALAMGAALAHALELPRKIGLDRDAYFTVQQIYAGWNMLAILLVVELAAMLAVIGYHRRRPSVARPAVAAVLCLVAAQVVFWKWTFPANQATSNWTVKPDTWEDLRRQWEYSHLAGAGFQVLAMVALIVSALRRGNERPERLPPM